MDSYINREIISMIMAAKKYLPGGWRIQTIDNPVEYNYLILHIDKQEFEKYNVHHQIQIAEVYTELCERIKMTGIPCYIQKM